MGCSQQQLSSTSNFFPIVRHAIEELKKSINAMSVQQKLQRGRAEAVRRPRVATQYVTRRLQQHSAHCAARRRGRGRCRTRMIIQYMPNDLTFTFIVQASSGTLTASTLTPTSPCRATGTTVSKKKWIFSSLFYLGLRWDRQGPLKKRTEDFSLSNFIKLQLRGGLREDPSCTLLD